MNAVLPLLVSLWLFEEPLPAAAIEWTTGLAATALPEGQPYPRLYEALDGLLAAIEASPSARSWAPSLVRYELFVLAELGFGLDLDSCAVSGIRDNLVAVSPRSGRAVSAAEAEPHAGKLLALAARRAGGRGGPITRLGLAALHRPGAATVRP